MNILNSLRAIVQDVNGARNLPEVLTIIVKKVQATMQAEVCSIYLFDETDQRYVLMATEGLRQESIGTVRLSLGEGLVGLVAAKEEPLNLDNADKHPNFVYFEEIGEEIFHSFLGVPIIHHRKVLGVLVLQQQTQRRFAAEEEAFVVTVCAQLSGAIAHAEATGALRRLASADLGAGRKQREAIFHGIPSSPGVGIGHVVLAQQTVDLYSVPERFSEDPDTEVEIFRQALKAVKRDMQNLGGGLQGKLNSEELALFDVFIRMLDDTSLGGEVIEAIKTGHTAQSAWSSVILKHVRTFQEMDDPYLRERAADVDGLGKRVLSYLVATNRQDIPLPRRIVLVGEDLSATALADIPVNRLVGIISLRGSSNSHLAIVARALGIPTVMGAIDVPWTELEGEELIVDGFNGHVVSRASRTLRRSYLQRQKEEKILIQDLQKLRDVPCKTPDGSSFSLWVNTGLRQDTIASLRSGAEAVGLFRTEIPFLSRSSFPTEDEQVAIYREHLETFAPRPVTMRTLDIGGDKDLPYFPIDEENPFLGWRGIRISLDHPEIFLVQIRALLRASEGLDNLRIMLPMISTITELDDALDLIKRAHKELVSEDGYNIMMPPIGAMIEVPAAVYQVAEIGQRVDFLSIGTNDLVQYLLAVDRNNPRVAGLYDAFHPSVLRALKIIFEQAESVGCQLSVCGEMAGSPHGAVLLFGMGYKNLSMSATALLRVKATLLATSSDQAREIASRASLMTDASSVADFVSQSLEEIGC